MADIGAPPFVHQDLHPFTTLIRHPTDFAVAERSARWQSISPFTLRRRKLMSGIRTVVVTTPAMLLDLIKRLALSRVDLDIVAEFKARHALGRRLGKIRPDLVVIGLRGNENDAVIRDLLEALPTAKFIAFAANGRAARGVELRLYHTDLGDAPPDKLVDFIRSCSVSFRTQQGARI